MTYRFNASLISKIFFNWMTPVIKRANSGAFKEDSLAQRPEHASCFKEAQLFEDNLRRAGLSGIGLILAGIRTFRAEFIIILLISLSCILTQSANPLLQRQLLLSLQGEAAPAWFLHYAPKIFGANIPSFAYALGCAIALALNSAALILSVHHIFFIQPATADRLRGVINATIYQKALKQRRDSRLAQSNGYLMNLVSTDSAKIAIICTILHMTWVHPFLLIIAVALLFKLVGYPALIGCATLFVLVCLSITISRRQNRLRRELSATADRRVALTRESLIHIKAAKLQGWQSNLARKIQSLRETEVLTARAIIKLSAILSFSSGSAPAIAMATTSMILFSLGERLDAATVFPMLSLFVMLRYAFSNLPETLYGYIEAAVAWRRIAAFLASEEYTPSPTDINAPDAIAVLDTAHEWAPGVPALKVNELRIKRGELVVVVGTVGSGKSALLLSILGELRTTQGQVKLGGSISYVSQNPWIISESIRDNILSGSAFDSQLYRRVIRACELSTDLASFSNGDLTEIGERGVNLSGGQRHRVALARAAYAGADIYLFDDPLSALDPQVAREVFNRLITQELAKTTRIVVSHRVEFAMAADRILVVENGVIVEDGTPTSLRQRGSKFSEFLEYSSKIATEKKMPQAQPALTATEDQSSQAALEDTLEAQEEAFDNWPELTTTDRASAIISKEERRTGAVSASTTREYLSRLAPGAIALLLIALFIGRQSAAFANDLWLAKWAGNPEFSGASFIYLYLTSILMLCVLAYMRSVFVLNRGLNAGVVTHERLLYGVFNAPLRFFESNPVGRILNRFSRDLDTVELQLPRSILDAGHCACETLATLLVVTVITPITLALILPLAVIYFIFFKAYRPVSRETQRLASIRLSPILTIFSESLVGLETLRSSGIKTVFTNRFFKSLDRYATVMFNQTGSNRWLGIRLEILGVILIAAVAVSAAVGANLGVGVAFSGLVISYAGSMTGSMNWAIRSLSMVENNLTSFERMERYASTASERDPKTPAPAHWPLSGAISIENLSVRYRDELPAALSDINCQIPDGARVGIIGRTGSGKSTLVLTLLRLINPLQGTIKIDGIDTADISLDALRSAVAVIPQEPILFSGRLRDSLDPFNSYTDEQVRQALLQVGLNDLLALPAAGLDAPVSEGGLNFSNGQRQLICLARALLRQSRIVVLDEATASIDVKTDHAIQRVIRREFSGSTVLVIAHRVGTVLDSDLIIGLKDGALVEVGSPTELLERDSLLARFVEQARADIS
jgi:ABC-type multidrug transport system fused ATPase/permease subunit